MENVPTKATMEQNLHGHVLVVLAVHRHPTMCLSHFLCKVERRVGAKVRGWGEGLGFMNSTQAHSWDGARHV